MSVRPIIRLAAEADAAQIAAIYAPVVIETPISFEIEPPSAEEMARRVAAILPGHPWLVCEHDDVILGYAYAGVHRTRAAYQWSTETTVYIGRAARRQGVGRALYTALFDVLPLQGFTSALAGITLPNDGSVGLHESMGFRPIGTFHNIGHKLGRWHDVGWWERPLQEHTAPAGPPVPLAAVSGSTAFQAGLERAMQSLKI